MLSVADETISAPAIASRGFDTGMTSMPSLTDISSAKASLWPFVGLYTRHSFMDLTQQNASKKVLAMPPEPIRPMTSESSRDRYLAPIPAPPPTRKCCKIPSLISANGSPFLVDSKNINPQYVPGSIQCFSSVHPPSSVLGQLTMSDFIRIAK